MAGYHQMRHLLMRSLVTSSASRLANPPRYLITGGMGQLGPELAKNLRDSNGKESVILSDIKSPSKDTLLQGHYVQLDVCDLNKLRSTVKSNGIDCVVHFAVILSATGEKNVEKAMEVNIRGFHNVLEICRELGLRLYCPSTIGAFGLSSPKTTPDLTVQRPRTIYGVAKVYMELMGEYFLMKSKRKDEGFVESFDFRSMRYPGVISVDTPPGGGTTDYAVDMIKEAVEKGCYLDCPLKENTRLPMIYLPDVIKATVLCLQAPEDHFRPYIHPEHKMEDHYMRTYNVQAISFTPGELASEIRKHIPEFKLEYKLDQSKQDIADSWPEVLDDKWARENLGWKPDYDLEKMVRHAVERFREKSRT